MTKREYMLPPDAIVVRVGNAELLVNAVCADQVRVQTPAEGVAVRGCRLSAQETFFHENGEWKSWQEEKTRFRMSVKVVDQHRDGSDAQRRAVQSLFRQAAESFASAHPLLLAEAAVAAANNDVARADAEFAKAEKAYNLALDAREAALRREEDAKETLDRARSGDPAPGPGLR